MAKRKQTTINASFRYDRHFKSITNPNKHPFIGVEWVNRNRQPNP